MIDGGNVPTMTPAGTVATKLGMFWRSLVALRGATDAALMRSPALVGSPATALAGRVMPLQRRVVRCYVTGVTLFPGS